MNNKNENSTLRKSASLILLCAEKSGSQGNYRTLLLKRKSSMSFSNSYVFPGGKCEQEDIQVAKTNNFRQYTKITAIRQFLEESGILLYPIEKEPNVLTEQFLFKSIQEISKQLGAIWNDSLGYIEPVLRLMTPQATKGKRFDCMFHLCRLNGNVKLVNIQLLRKDIKLQKNVIFAQNGLQVNKKYSVINNTEIIYDQAESDGYVFDSPQNIITQFKKGNISLAPPQVMISTALTNLCTPKNQDQLNEFSLNAKNNKFTEIQPIMFHANISHGRFYLFGDKNYDFQLLLSKQIDSPSKKTLQNYFKKKVSSNFIEPNGVRYIDLREEAKYQNSYKGKLPDSLLNFLQNISQDQRSKKITNCPSPKI